MPKRGFRHSLKSITKLSGENNHMYGKHHTAESRIKMSEAQAGENNHMYNRHHTTVTVVMLPQTADDPIGQTFSSGSLETGSANISSHHKIRSMVSGIIRVKGHTA